MSYLKIKNLIKNQGSFALEVENIEIKKGEIFGILGHSGAGKSTLLNLISGLIMQDRGEIILDNVDISKKSSYSREIAYVFQNSLLFDHLNVKENLEYLLSAKGVKKSLHENIVTKALKECEAFCLKDRDITTLSGGEKQRVALACALMFEPKLLILDEPFSNLDKSLKIKMRAFLKTMVKKHNLTTLMVTHDSDDAFSMFDKMLLLNRGKIIQIGSPKEIYERPNSLQSANFFALDNIFRGSVENGVFTSYDFRLKVDRENGENIILHIPQNIIKLDENGESVRIKDKLFLEGRWKMVLENGVTIYSVKELFGLVKILIKREKVLFLKDEK